MSPLSKLKKLYFNAKSLYRGRAIEHRKTSKLVNNIVQLSLELKQKFKTHSGGNRNHSYCTIMTFCFPHRRQSDENTVPAFVRYATFVILLLFKAKCICFFVGFSKDIRISGRRILAS